MPQADELSRDRARRLFGTLDCGAVETWLKRQGLILNSDWTWTSDRPLTDDETFAVGFLIDEWDYGGLRRNT